MRQSFRQAPLRRDRFPRIGCLAEGYGGFVVRPLRSLHSEDMNQYWGRHKECFGRLESIEENLCHSDSSLEIQEGEVHLCSLAGPDCMMRKQERIRRSSETTALLRSGRRPRSCTDLDMTVVDTNLSELDFHSLRQMVAPGDSLTL